MKVHITGEEMQSVDYLSAELSNGLRVSINECPETNKFYIAVWKEGTARSLIVKSVGKDNVHIELD